MLFLHGHQRRQQYIEAVSAQEITKSLRLLVEIGLYPFAQVDEPRIILQPIPWWLGKHPPIA